MRGQAFHLFNALLVVDTHSEDAEKEKAHLGLSRNGGVGEEKPASPPCLSRGQMGTCT